MTPFLAVALGLAHLAGLLSIPHVLATGRTVQGTIAWTVALLTLPYAAVPMYWVLGRYKYLGYIHARRAGDREIHGIAESLAARVEALRAPMDGEKERFLTFAELARMPFTAGNRAELFAEARAAFDSMWSGIERAQDYILVQFYILRDDGIGKELKRRLVERARAGVRVYLLYDVIGCYNLPPQYLAELREADVQVRGFGTLRRRINRLQINFRNHRKTLVVDGHSAWIGGLNVGDEYLGHDPRFGKWRDTHVLIEGPVVQGAQLAFLEDWYWATHQVPELDWCPSAVEGSDQPALAMPTGPADALESCSLYFLHAIHSAKRRLWIASAYFVPDLPIVDALQLAALRGVEVRILLPEKADHPLVWLSSFSYYAEMHKVGIEIYRYLPGFMHQKVLVVDDDFAAVGTPNLDNRSFRLNFEISVLVADRGFATSVAAMLERDFERSHLTDPGELQEKPWWFWAGVRIARLMAPVQ